MKFKILLILALFFNQKNFSQNIIKGRIVDCNKNPIEFANVVFYSIIDTVMHKGIISNHEGEFFLEIDKPEIYFMQISFIGYETQNLPLLEDQTICLKNINVGLDEVIVNGNLPNIRIKEDAIITTVHNSILSKAGTGNDVLKRIPSLVGKDGVFSVFGKGNAKIYINNLEVRDPSDIENLNSEDIREVQVINNPGARYDASIKAVIKINLLKKTGNGLSFDFRTSYYQSQNTDLREQLNYNFRKGKWDLLGTLFYARDAWAQESNLLQINNGDTIWTQENSLIMKGLSQKFRGVIGVNYEISKEQFIGIKYTNSIFPYYKSLSSLSSSVKANDTFYDNWISLENNRLLDEPLHQYNAYYNGMLGSLNIDINTDFYKQNKISRTDVYEKSIKYDDRIINSENQVSNRLYALKLILTYPIFGGKFILGGEFTNTHRKDLYTNKGGPVPSSFSVQKERNNSLLFEYKRDLKIGELAGGLRYERVNSKYFFNDNKVEDQSRIYHQWFPNISFTSKLKEVSTQLSYSVKTLRPTYRELSNNIYYANRLTLQTGNPYLRPSINHDITLVTSWNWLQLIASYKVERDAIINSINQAENNRSMSVLSFINIDKLPSVSFYLTLSPTLGVWTPQLNMGIIKQWAYFDSYIGKKSFKKPIPTISSKNSFNLFKNWLLNMDIIYQGPGHYQNIYISEHQVAFNFGFSKSLLDNKLRVELRANDIFKGLKDGNLLYGNRIELYQTNTYDSREIELTIRYRFNSVGSKYKGIGSGANEINRL